MPSVIESFPVETDHGKGGPWIETDSQELSWVAPCPIPAHTNVVRWRPGTLRDIDTRKRIPDDLASVRAAIENSRVILETRQDPEDPNSPLYTEDVWARAVKFLTENAKWLWHSYGRRIDAPAVLPGPDGSIDIHWDEPSYELLINIPTDPRSMAGFYGDDRGEISIKGRFDPRTANHGLLLWLARTA